MESMGVTFQDEFPTRLERLRAAGVLRYDLVQAEPVWCGLGRDGVDDDVQGDLRGLSAIPRGEALAGAREAVASYLAGHRASVRPEHVFFAPSRSAALRLGLDVVARPEDEILVPFPARPLFDAREDALRQKPYRLEFGEDWHLDRKSLRRAVGPRTRAIVAGNPAEPTGSMLGAADLRALEELCAAREIALIGDEALIDTAIGTDVSVARAERVLAIHVSGLTGVCGLPGAAWVAVAGAPPLTASAAERLEVLSAARPQVPATALRSVAALLARRESHLAGLRARIAKNRGSIARASLREAPWSLLWGTGGAWAVLQINPTRDDRELCLELLDEGVAVRPGSLDGFPPTGHIVVSLLPEPDVLLGGLEVLERHLRRVQ